MGLEAVIFDMDGVLSETQRLHARAQSEVLADRFGVEMPPKEITRRYAGKPPGELFAEKTNGDPMAAYEAKQERLYELVEAVGLDPVPGSRSLVRGASSKHDTAVASSSEPEFIELVLSELDISNRFDAVWSASEVERGKPHPDVFEAAAADVGASPENCLVIEDGTSGMRGAKDAGMTVVGLVTDPTADYPADETVSSLEDVTVEDLERIHSERS